MELAGTGRDREQRAEVLAIVARARQLTGKPLDEILATLGVDDATYFRWKRAVGQDVPAAVRRSARSRGLPPTPEEAAAVVRCARAHPQMGYKRLAWLMVEQGVCFLRPYQVYEVLRESELLARRERRADVELRRPAPPERPDEIWHMDLMYVRVGSKWMYLIDVVDGYSRFLVHWRLKPTMLDQDVSLVAQEALETLPERRPGEPKVVHDRGCQFMGREWRRWVEAVNVGDIPIRVRHPQSNGKIERMHRTHREEGLAGTDDQSYDGLRETLENWTAYYNWKRPHSALNYLTPGTYYRGKPEEKLEIRAQRLQTGDRLRAEYWQRTQATEEPGTG